MITMAFLNDFEHLHQPDYHYTVLLYSRTENYEDLCISINKFLCELRDLKENGMTISNIYWNFELYLIADWKFLALSLGFNSANSKFFCIWCNISKDRQGDMEAEFSISELMDILKENYQAYKRHNKPPLFDMIPFYNIVPDELHIMLCITD